jgi:hypothetical protein
MPLVIRFPDGTKEYRYPEKMLAEGDIVRHNGDRYRVMSVSTDDGTTNIVVESESPNVSDTLKSERGAVAIDLSEWEVREALT